MNLLKSVIVGCAIITPSAYAEIPGTAYETIIGAQVVARTVLEKNLLTGSNSVHGNATLKLALETGQANISQMLCERAAGVDHCSVLVDIEDNEISYQLKVTIVQGAVGTATWDPYAG